MDIFRAGLRRMASFPSVHVYCFSFATRTRLLLHLAERLRRREINSPLLLIMFLIKHRGHAVYWDICACLDSSIELIFDANIPYLHHFLVCPPSLHPCARLQTLLQLKKGREKRLQLLLFLISWDTNTPKMLDVHVWVHNPRKPPRHSSLLKY